MRMQLAVVSAVCAVCAARLRLLLQVATH